MTESFACVLYRTLHICSFADIWYKLIFAEPLLQYTIFICYLLRTLINSFNFNSHSQRRTQCCMTCGNSIEASVVTTNKPNPTDMYALYLNNRFGVICSKLQCIYDGFTMHLRWASLFLNYFTSHVVQNLNFRRFSHTVLVVCIASVHTS